MDEVLACFVQDVLKCSPVQLFQSALLRGNTSIDGALLQAGFTVSSKRQLQGNVPDGIAIEKPSSHGHK